MGGKCAVLEAQPCWHIPCVHLRSALPSPRLNSSACPPPAALPTCSSDPALVEAERSRFLRALHPLLVHPGPKLIVTDSQVGRRLWGVPCCRLCCGPLAGWPDVPCVCLGRLVVGTRLIFAASFYPLPQAVDILHPWTLDPATGEELVPFTTFRCGGRPGKN